MKKLLAAFLLFASALAVAASPPPDRLPKLLDEKEVKNPEFVSKWLAGYGSNVNQKEADWFYSLGVKQKESNNWSAAAKAFGESMRRYPRPHAISDYADAELKMMGEIRAREGFPPSKASEDMEHAIWLYKSSLAANSVTRTLSQAEARRIEEFVSCLAEYLKTSQPSGNCPPSMYFSESHRKK